MEREEIIRGLFCNGHTQKEIIWILDKVYSYRISDRHLRRILKSYSLCRRALNRDHQSIFNAVKNEIQICSPMIGVKAMHRKIRDLKGIRPCYRNDVYQVMRVLDPYGLQFRRPGQCRIPRIVYSCRGPNDVWHIDGNDKLKFYGIWIHLCIDGFSRRVIWLNAGTTNRKPDIIGRYFLNAVDSANGCPRLVRSDRGIENVLVAIFQTSFRYYHNDSCSGSKSFRFGKSVHNQRAECFFGHLKKSWISMWQQNFETMVAAEILDLSNPVNIHCLQFCFLPLIDQELKFEQCEWNGHLIRKQRGFHNFCAKPDVLYFAPPNGKENNICLLDPELRNYAENFAAVAGQHLLVASEEFRNLSCQFLLQCGYTMPKTRSQAFDCYQILSASFDFIINRLQLCPPQTFVQAIDVYHTIFHSFY
ncbi:uncharacterized protein LOC121403094 [Xenopus laevis]|uniref:Uncharacterized protein LOC121403094 n=1 Tax=Xenopus laevis TaxID=8355 RepID=A0A8J1MYP6_XENLA|nr:uncharacterized protein LOC121403094 [Xenopus laevis]